MYSFTANKSFFIIFISFLTYKINNDIKPIIKAKSDLHIYDLKINHLSNPLGIDINYNSFSFLSDQKGPFRASIISLDNNQTILSKKILLENCHSFYFNRPLKYQTSYLYRVEDAFNINEIKFETAAELKDIFITPKNKEIKSPIFIKEFESYNINEIIKARLYITGLGLYQAFINEKKVGKGYLTPGYNDYDYYLRYQTYDIYNLLKEKNKIEVHMGNGWYKGRFWLKEKNTFGSDYILCAKIYLKYKNGNEINIYTDISWKVKKSKEVMNNIYDGEIIDYTLPESDLEDVIEFKNNKKYHLIPDFGALIEEKEIIKPSLIISAKNESILDFHQNIVGFVRYRGHLKKGQNITFDHGEILQNNLFYNDNYRTAKAIAKYTSDGIHHRYEPKFTFYGFRYVLVKGFEKNKLISEDFEGVVLYTNLERTILYDSYDEINKIISNSLRSQKGNFLDVPTDCPQRDERMGWTGDAQVFSNTACFNMDSYIFYKKFMKDLRMDQIHYYKGDIPAFSPSLKQQSMPGGAIWADAGIIIPWNIYLNYGDINLLKESYKMMKDYAETLINKDILQGNTHLILEGFTFGDWLALDGDNPESNQGGTDPGFIMTVYYYHSIDLISLVAKELNYLMDYLTFSRLKQNIYDAILNHFYDENGKLKLDTQTAYVLSLHYKIYKNKDIIIQNFKKRLEKDLYLLKTGFCGTPLLLLALFDNDMDQYAYKILYNRYFPGWLYTIKLGATSIWERWDSLLPDGSINKHAMNSFNHYASGSVCEAIYSRIGGLVNLAPGWKKVRIKPHINLRKKKFYLSYKSISGKYIINWEIKDKNKFRLKIVIPNGCKAEVVLPNGNIYNVNNGDYEFKCELNFDEDIDINNSTDI